MIPLGLDPGRYGPPGPGARAAAEGLWGGARHRVLTVGRLTYYKGHAALVEAAAGLEGARVFIVGEGAERGRLEAAVRGAGLEGSVVLAGRQTDETVRALLATCDCFCLPSLERTEAFGLVLLEAMAYGRPAVVTDVRGSGMGWVVQHGETGLVARAGDAASLRRALAAILEDEPMRSRMGRAARERFEGGFRIEEPAARIAGLYRALVAPAPR
jgi:rhamnosyl/mannosyltransferase